MSLHDKKIKVNKQATDEICADMLTKQLSRAIKVAQTCMRRVSKQVSRAPGGIAGLVVALGDDSQEVVDVLTKLEALINAHKRVDDEDVVSPLVQDNLA